MANESASASSNLDSLEPNEKLQIARSMFAWALGVCPTELPEDCHVEFYVDNKTGEWHIVGNITAKAYLQQVDVEVKFI